MPTLPPEIVSDLLSRLPVKSLLRFRCTSKHLCSIIDDPYFTKLHLDHSARTNSNQSVIVTISPICSLDLHSLKRAVEVDHPLKAPQCKTEVIGSRNGLLCLFNSHDEIVIWNMSTRKHHRLPYTEINFPNEDPNVMHQVAYGFGYDSVHDDYKLFRIVRFYTSGSEVMVYSLKSNSWKRIRDFPYDFLASGSMGTFANGALLWLVTVDLPEGNFMLIAGYDVESEKLRLVPPNPETPDVSPSVQKGMGVWEGRVCEIRNHVGERTDLWALKHYRMDDCWEKVLSISEPQLTTSGSVMPITPLPNGKGLLMLKNNRRFLKYDPKRKKVKDLGIGGLPPYPYLFDATPYVESMVNPFSMLTGDDRTAGRRESGRSKKNVRKRDDFLSAGFKLFL